MDSGLTASDIAVLSDNTGRNNDSSWGNDGGAWWIILFLIFAFCGLGNNGWGGNGGNGGGQGGYDTRADIQRGLITQEL